jgi:hypothetical protein
VGDGHCEFIADGLDDELASGVAEHRLVGFGVEVVLFELLAAGQAQEQSFGEQRLEHFREIKDQGVAMSFHGAVQKGDTCVQRGEADAGEDPRVHDAVDVADEGVSRVARRPARSSVKLQPFRQAGVEYFPGRASEVSFGAHELFSGRGRGCGFFQHLVRAGEQLAVDHAADVESCGEHDVACYLESRDGVGAQVRLGHHGLPRGGGI